LKISEERLHSDSSPPIQVKAYSVQDFTKTIVDDFCGCRILPFFVKGAGFRPILGQGVAAPAKFIFKAGSLRFYGRFRLAG
jgi:hypothetical protein